MDNSRRPLKELSQDELVALALEKGISINELDEDEVMEYTEASLAGQNNETDDSPDQAPDPPSIPGTCVWETEPGAGDAAREGDLAAYAGALGSGDVPWIDAASASPPHEDQDATSSSWPQLPPPPSPIVTGDGTLGGARGSAPVAAAAVSVSSADGKGGATSVAIDTAAEDRSKEISKRHRQELVDTFVGVTQESRSKAWQFLNATDWSISAAINLFMESGGDSVGTGSAGGGNEAGKGSVDDGATVGDGGHGGRIARPIVEAASPSGTDLGRETARVSRSRGSRGGRSRRARRNIRDGDKNDDDVFDDASELASPASMEDLLNIPGLARSMAHASHANRSTPSATGSGGEAGTHDSRYPNGYSEDGVRAPIPNRRDILIGGADPDETEESVGRALRAAMGSRSPASAEEKDTTDWIFHPPEGLSLPSSFMDTRTICKEQKKWLMVNIQDHEEFASHRLNKDVWSNETIQTLLRGNFIFWQRNKTLGQARYYMEKYNLAGQVLPHTAIIDPRTGAQLVKVVGFVEPEDLSTALLEFLESNNMDQTKAPKLKTIGMGNVVHESEKYTPGKGGIGDERNSPSNNSSGGGVGDGYNVYESFGSEDYEYDDDDEDLGQVSSVDGNDGDSTSRTSTGTSVSTPNVSNLSAIPIPASPSVPSNREPRKPSVGASDRAAAAAALAVRGADLLGPWGHGTLEDESAARALLGDEDPGSSQGIAGGGEGMSETLQEVPREPEAGEGVTQVRFRLPNGVTPPTIARRFWLQDRVSILFQYVRTTVEDASTRPFDLLSGHPPTSLSASKHLTVEAANLSNSAILMRWK